MEACARCGVPQTAAGVCSSCLPGLDYSTMLAAPGWYFDGTGEQPYWDGTRWSVSAVEYYAERQSEASPSSDGSVAIRSNSPPASTDYMNSAVGFPQPTQSERKQLKAETKARKRADNKRRSKRRSGSIWSSTASLCWSTKPLAGSL